MYQDMMDTIGFVGKYDPEVSAAMEKDRQTPLYILLYYSQVIPYWA